MNFIQAQVSFHRLEQFLKLGELRAENVIRNMPSQFRIENGTFCWDRTEDIPVLRNINVKIPSGSLVAVVGQVGCGKSTLLSALLEKTEKLDGKVYVKVWNYRIYIPQQAWIQNATLQENVLFGQSRDSERYKHVISACALDPDIEVFYQRRDLTEIGEKDKTI
ncbi:Multidrug resistance-associated protein 1 [Desmophyllum pertusum]|uniref:Multidrug resistance-associated protein 1 n=1 Tax=Desmophyllum pertusum TaxID=174260 RepID=A0A9X0A0M4_9CNID|nr:Multidrug resistance-associated protein 1 [Desmophyllum pertusum]